MKAKMSNRRRTFGCVSEKMSTKQKNVAVVLTTSPEYTKIHKIDKIQPLTASFISVTILSCCLVALGSNSSNCTNNNKSLFRRTSSLEVIREPPPPPPAGAAAAPEASQQAKETILSTRVQLAGKRKFVFYYHTINER